MARSDEEVDRHIRRIAGSMAFEDITLSDECIDGCRAILRGEADADELVKELIAKTTQSIDKGKRRAI